LRHKLAGRRRRWTDGAADDGQAALFVISLQLAG
jgi:hypothetical protein